MADDTVNFETILRESHALARELEHDARRLSNAMRGLPPSPAPGALEPLPQSTEALGHEGGRASSDSRESPVETVSPKERCVREAQTPLHAQAERDPDSSDRRHGGQASIADAQPKRGIVHGAAGLRRSPRTRTPPSAKARSQSTPTSRIDSSPPVPLSSRKARVLLRAGRGIAPWDSSPVALGPQGGGCIEDRRGTALGLGPGAPGDTHVALIAEMEHEMEEQEHTIHKFRDQMLFYRRKCDALNQRLHQYADTDFVSELQNQVDEKEREIAALRAETRSLRTTTTRQAKALVELERTIEQLRNPSEHVFPSQQQLRTLQDRVRRIVAARKANERTLVEALTALAAYRSALAHAGVQALEKLGKTGGEAPLSAAESDMVCHWILKQVEARATAVGEMQRWQRRFWELRDHTSYGYDSTKPDGEEKEPSSLASQVGPDEDHLNARASDATAEEIGPCTKSQTAENIHTGCNDVSVRRTGTTLSTSDSDWEKLCESIGLNSTVSTSPDIASRPVTDDDDTKGTSEPRLLGLPPRTVLPERPLRSTRNDCIDDVHVSLSPVKIQPCEENSNVCDMSSATKECTPGSPCAAFESVVRAAGEVKETNPDSLPILPCQCSGALIMNKNDENDGKVAACETPRAGKSGAGTVSEEGVLRDAAVGAGESVAAREAAPADEEMEAALHEAVQNGENVAACETPRRRESGAGTASEEGVLRDAAVGAGESVAAREAAPADEELVISSVAQVLRNSQEAHENECDSGSELFSAVTTFENERNVDEESFYSASSTSGESDDELDFVDCDSGGDEESDAAFDPDGLRIRRQGDCHDLPESESEVICEISALPRNYSEQNSAQAMNNISAGVGMCVKGLLNTLAPSESLCATGSTACETNVAPSGAAAAEEASQNNCLARTADFITPVRSISHSQLDENAEDQSTVPIQCMSRTCIASQVSRERALPIVERGDDGISCGASGFCAPEVESDSTNMPDIISSEYDCQAGVCASAPSQTKGREGEVVRTGTLPSVSPPRAGVDGTIAWTGLGCADSSGESILSQSDDTVKHPSQDAHKICDAVEERCVDPGAALETSGSDANGSPALSSPVSRLDADQLQAAQAHRSAVGRKRLTTTNNNDIRSIYNDPTYESRSVGAGEDAARENIEWIQRIDCI